jgi:hypothetical protein
MKKRIIYLLICFTVGVSIITTLWFISVKTLAGKNGFVRLLPSHKVVGVISKDIKHNIWYISGVSNQKICLGNYLSPGRLALVDQGLKDYQELGLSGFEKVSVYKGSYMQIDSPFVYLMDGIKPIIIQGSALNFHLDKQIGAPYFTGAILLTDNSLALRCVNQKHENVLMKKSIGSDVLKTTRLLEKQVDGLFCTDGEIVKVPGSSKMIYVYYYRNQFLCADSNLNLLYKGKTIDTISHAQIKVANIHSTKQITMAAPPLYVNKCACANEKYLFVQSALRANNETDYMIKNVSTIDVYAVKDGKYQFSFYLPDFRGFKVRDFKVYGQSLYALYDHYLYKYQLNF